MHTVSVSVLLNSARRTGCVHEGRGADGHGVLDVGGGDLLAGRDGSLAWSRSVIGCRRQGAVRAGSVRSPEWRLRIGRLFAAPRPRSRRWLGRCAGRLPGGSDHIREGDYRLALAPCRGARPDPRSASTSAVVPAPPACETIRRWQRGATRPLTASPTAVSAVRHVTNRIRLMHEVRSEHFPRRRWQSRSSRP